MGRNRKSGERYPSGKLKPKSKPEVAPISGTAWQRLVQHGLALGADPRLVTELGRLNRFGELTIVQTTAGHRVAEIYGRYERLTGLTRSIRSPSYQRAFGGVRDVDTEALIAATENFAALQKTLDEMDVTGAVTIQRRDGTTFCNPSQLRAALEQLCVEDRPISPALYPIMRALLDELAVRWKISKGKGPRQLAHKSAKAERPAAVEPKKPSVDRGSFLTYTRALRPDLDAAQLEQAYELFQAVRDRAAFERGKARPPAAASPVTTTLDRPVLSLPNKEDTDA